MILDTSKPTERIAYLFDFYKYHKYKGKTILNIESNGSFNTQRLIREEGSNLPEYVFRSESYHQERMKDPLIFSPLKWIYNKAEHAASIKSKDHLKRVWCRYRDKYRRPENAAGLLVFERLLFNVPMGMEYDFFSNGAYLPFFIDIYDIDIEEETVLKTQDWVLMPMSIPVNTYFKCTKLTDESIYLDGWLTLDEDKLDELLTKEIFRQKAKSYHFSKDFRIESSIKVVIDIRNACLHSALFSLEISGENDSLHERMQYEVKGTMPLKREDEEPFPKRPKERYPAFSSLENKHSFLLEDDDESFII